MGSGTYCMVETFHYLQVKTLRYGAKMINLSQVTLSRIVSIRLFGLVIFLSIINRLSIHKTTEKTTLSLYSLKDYI